MRVLCCLDGTNIEQVHKAVSTMLRADALTIGIVYVMNPRINDGGLSLAFDRQI